RGLGARPARVPQLFSRDLGAVGGRRSDGTRRAGMAGPLTSGREIEREVATLRLAPGEDMPYQRTSVMTHTAWVPPEWVEAAEDVLAGLAERHPSRTIVRIPEPDAEDGLAAEVDVDVFQAGEGRQICAETIYHPPQGKRASAPARALPAVFLRR